MAGHKRRALAELLPVRGAAGKLTAGRPRRGAMGKVACRLCRRGVAPGQRTRIRRYLLRQRACCAHASDEHARGHGKERLHGLVKRPGLSNRGPCVHYLAFPKNPAAESFILFAVERGVGQDESDHAVAIGFLHRVEFGAAGVEVCREVLVRRHATAGPDIASLALLPEALLDSVRHVAISEPGRIPNDDVSALFL